MLKKRCYWTTNHCLLGKLLIVKKSSILHSTLILFFNRYVKVVKSSKAQFKNQASSMLTKNMMLKNCTPKFAPKKSIHKVKVFNQSDKAALSDSLNSKDDKRSENASDRIKISDIFPYYFDGAENRTKQGPNARYVSNDRNSSSRKGGIQSIGIPFEKSFSARGPSNHHESSPYCGPSHIRSPHANLSVRRPYVGRPVSHRLESSPKLTKTQNGNYYFQSYYNDDQLEKEIRLKTVLCKNLPKNTTKNDLYEFFAQFNLLPKHISIFVDRGRRLTEAEVVFRTMEDAKMSYVLSGSRLKSNRGSCNVDIIINPDLSKVNVINPIEDRSRRNGNSPAINQFSNSTLYERTHSIDRNYVDNKRKISTPVNDQYDFGFSRLSTGNHLSNSELINQLKSSIHESLGDYNSTYHNDSYSRRN